VIGRQRRKGDDVMASLSRRDFIASGLALGSAMRVTTPAHAQIAGGKYPVFGKVERLDPALDALIDADAHVEDVMSGFTWSEGPVWIGGPDGYLLVSDPRANVISQWSEARGGSVWLQPSGYEGTSPDLAEPGVNGQCLGRGGALLVADGGNRCISRLDLATKRKSVIADRFEGKRFNSPNDLCVSPVDGAIYFTDPPYGLRGGANSTVRELDFTGVFRLAPDSTVTLIGKYQRPNGIGISPDGRTLYHSDSQQGWIAHTLDAQGRSVSERPFVDRAAQGMTGSGDGFRVDAAGNVWMSSRDGISILSPAGKRLGIVRLNDVVSNCEIGADGHLYMTANRKLARVAVKARKLRV
jgi:gluconolactonase